ncbi:MAG: RadC family protein [Betaproteobacteria bacterium]
MHQSIDSMSDAALLGTLVGPRAAASFLKDAGGSLASMLDPDTTSHPPKGAAGVKLSAARELVRRALAATLGERDVLTSPELVREYLQVALAQRQHEIFMVLFLNAQNQLIAPEEMFRGTLTQTSVYPREVVKRALSWNAASVILAHNHPSGVAEPSRADEYLTQSLRSALALVDVRVLDHIVVAGSNVTSFVQRGLL